MKVYNFGDCGISSLRCPDKCAHSVERTPARGVCAREQEARGTEQDRGGSSRLPQAKEASAAGTLAAENISIGAARVFFEVHRS